MGRGVRVSDARHRENASIGIRAGQIGGGEFAPRLRRLRSGTRRRGFEMSDFGFGEISRQAVSVWVRFGGTGDAGRRRSGENAEFEIQIAAEIDGAFGCQIYFGAGELETLKCEFAFAAGEGSGRFAERGDTWPELLPGEGVGQVDVAEFRAADSGDAPALKR